MEKVTFEEFREEIWDTYVSEKIVSTSYMNENEGFINELTFDTYRLYLQSTCMDMKVFGKLFEIFFFNLFKFKAGNVNLEDDKIFIDY